MTTLILGSLLALSMGTAYGLRRRKIKQSQAFDDALGRAFSKARTSERFN